MVGFCLFELVLTNKIEFIRGFAVVFLLLQHSILFLLLIWCCATLSLTFRRQDWLLVCLLLMALVAYVNAPNSPLDFLVLAFGVTVGKGANYLINAHHFSTMRSRGHPSLDSFSGNSGSQLFFLLGVICLLAASACWQVDFQGHHYRWPRWKGLWDNPNLYGMLMGAGGVLAVGIIANEKFKIQKSKTILLFASAAAVTMFIGLMFSYSRGAWLGAGLGLLYLVWRYGKLKWRFVLPAVIFATVVALCFWGSTSDSAPWYVKRVDLGRPSAQNRATAWRAGLAMMRDHPLGVGWNNAVNVYDEKYSPPTGGAGAITTNDFLMLGAELGVAALLCFASYVALCLRGKGRMFNEENRIQATCRAGAIVLLVTFWFDGGLFKLPTAALFWVLLDLGAARKVVSSELLVNSPQKTT